MTIADLAVAVRIYWIKAGLIRGVPENLVDPCPLLLANMEAILAVPEIKAYMSKHKT